MNAGPRSNELCPQFDLDDIDRLVTDDCAGDTSQQVSERYGICIAAVEGILGGMKPMCLGDCVGR
jgi:hypothetical protein